MVTLEFIGKLVRMLVCGKQMQMCFVGERLGVQFVDILNSF